MNGNGDRRTHQRTVEMLLEQIARDTQQLHRLRVAGVRGRALSGRKQELAGVRRQLSSLVGGE